MSGVQRSGGTRLLAGLALVGLVAACAGPGRSGSEPTPAPSPAAGGPALTQSGPAATSTALVQPPRSPIAAPSASPAAAASPGPFAIEDAIALARHYTVGIETDVGSGAGVSVGGGAVLTALRVVQDARAITVRFPSGHQESADLLGTDPRRDLALIRAGFGNEPFAPMGEPTALPPGAAVLAVGLPRAARGAPLDPSVAQGTFLARQGTTQGVAVLLNTIALNANHLGGPLADDQGRLLGLVTGTMRDPSGAGQAVAAEELQAFLASPGPAPTPLPSVEPTAPPAPPTAVPTARPTPEPARAAALPDLGLSIRVPANGAGVPEKITLEGVQARRTPPGFHIWMIVRAVGPGAAWYPAPGEIVARPDGGWSKEIYLGGPPGTRHEIRLGTVADETHADLLRHVAEHPDQPLVGWEVNESFGSARITVVRQ